jgi:urea transport system substrate-binding protein
MDATNHHLHKPVMIGEIESNGQFNVVWQTENRYAPSRGVRGSPVMIKTRSSGENRQQLSSPGAAPGE